MGARHERAFYRAMAAVMALTVFIGFAPTYYLGLFTAGPIATNSGRPFTPLVHVHGALFTAWALLFVIQTVLVAQRRVRLHRRLGAAGIILAILMVASGFAISATRMSTAVSAERAAVFVVPVFEMVLFATFVTLAFVLRRDPESHKRLMLLAYASILEAAIGRLPYMRVVAGMVGRLPGGQPWFASTGIALLFVLVAVTYDVLSRRRVHKVYVWGGTLLALMTPIRLFISQTGTWRAFVGLFAQ